MTLRYTAEIYAEDDGYSSVCPELVVASFGDTVEEARTMLVEAIELTLEDITPEEYEYRVSGQLSADSDIDVGELLEDPKLVEASVIEVNVELPFVPAR